MLCEEIAFFSKACNGRGIAPTFMRCVINEQGTFVLFVEPLERPGEWVYRIVNKEGKILFEHTSPVILSLMDALWQGRRKLDECANKGVEKLPELPNIRRRSKDRAGVPALRRRRRSNETRG